MLRRIATTLCIFNIKKVPSFQIGCMMWMTTFWMGYSLSVKPFEDPVLNKMEVVNELLYNLLLLLCFTFTSFMPDLGARDSIGYVYIGLICTMLLVNISVQIKDSL